MPETKRPSDSQRDTLARPQAVPLPRLPEPDGASGIDAGKYSDFKVLLDDPAEWPGLRFDEYAQALADLISQSRAAFAVGIFGGWGTGKTTLMRRVETLLTKNEQVVSVWFAAWRYEKEPHLIVPLLDVLRETLQERADQLDRRARHRRHRWRASSGARSENSAWAREAAVMIAKAGQAFLAGLTVSANLPGVQATFSPGPVIDKITAGKADPGPLSFYHAGFGMLSDAIASLSANGTRRLVVFVDDLDRCLAPNVMDLLESMKVFFDVAGCVFVAGLDPEIAERAVATKVIADDPAVPSTAAGYLSKIFQVPFTLPLISGNNLATYLDSIESHSDFGDDQRADFRDTVRLHLTCLQDTEQVNPREIKRLINSYVVQLKMLSLRRDVMLEPGVVLALLCMNFRPDWKAIYGELAADPEYFQSIMREAVEGEEWPSSVWLSGTGIVLPRNLVEYLNGYARSLLHVPDLRQYISAAESTWSIDPNVLAARTVVAQLRKSVDDVVRGRLDRAEAASRLRTEIYRLSDLLRSLTGLLGRPQVLRQDALAAVSEVADLFTETMLAGEQGSDHGSDEATVPWAREVNDRLDSLATALRELYLYVSVGA